MPKEVGLQLTTANNEVLLCITKAAEGYTRGKSTTVVLFSKAEAEALAAELLLHSRRLSNVQ